MFAAVTYCYCIFVSFTESTECAQKNALMSSLRMSNTDASTILVTLAAFLMSRYND